VLGPAGGGQHQWPGLAVVGRPMTGWRSAVGQHGGSLEVGAMGLGGEERCPQWWRAASAMTMCDSKPSHCATRRERNRCRYEFLWAYSPRFRYRGI
jgi:hypothetical protein